MPLVDIQLIEGVFDKAQKQKMISKVTEAVLSVYGENLRPHTWVMVEDVPSGQWGLGGTGLTTEAVKELRGAVAAR